MIIRPNTITPGHSFAQEGNTFTEILPTPPPQPTEKDPNTEGISTAPVTKLALVHSTTKLDIETRWLCQWDSESSNTISVRRTFFFDWLSIWPWNELEVLIFFLFKHSDLMKHKSSSSELPSVKPRWTQPGL